MKRPAYFLAALLVPTVATAAAVRPASVERRSKALEFSYKWPAGADSIPGLRSYLRADMRKAFRQARSDAAEDMRRSRANHYPFRQHSYSMAWDAQGETVRLISLEGALAFDTNGAHPNSATRALLWDRTRDRRVSAPALFATPARFSALTRPAYCRKLDAERARRRGSQRDEGEFSKCPDYKELAIILVDRNQNRRFDRLKFVASPYVAGPYVEGEYENWLPVTANLIAALKREYRGSFEIQRQ